MKNELMGKNIFNLDIIEEEILETSHANGVTSTGCCKKDEDN